MSYDAFISFKNTREDGQGLTRDREIAETLHKKLRSEGMNVFFSEKDLSTANFIREISTALEEAKILILVGTKPERINSRWVQEEWISFLGAINSGKKPDGQIITVLEDMRTNDLPIMLSKLQSFSSSNLDDAVDYIFKMVGKQKRSDLLKWEEEEKKRKAQEKQQKQLAELQAQYEAQKKADEEKKRQDEEFARQKELLDRQQELLEKQQEIEARREAREQARNARREQTKNTKRRHEDSQKDGKAWIIAAVILCTAAMIAAAAFFANSRTQENIKPAVSSVPEETLSTTTRAIKTTKATTTAKTTSTQDRKYYNLEVCEFDCYKAYFSSGEFKIIGLVEEYKNNKVYSIPKEFDGIPVTSIGISAFDSCGAESIVIPDSVTYIGESAFSNCSNLTSINIPNGITNICDDTFNSCQSLTSINIPKNVTSIGKNAFLNCKKLTSVSIPNSVTFIGAGAFCGCSRITSINIPNGITNICDDTFNSCQSLTSINIPKNVKSIGENAFCYCSKLKKINIPDNVTTISSMAFCGCPNLTVTAPGDPSSYGYTDGGYRKWIIK